MIILEDKKKINKMISNRCRGKLHEKRITMRDVAASLKMSESTIYKKMSGQSDITAAELFLIAFYFQLTHEEVNYILYG